MKRLIIILIFLTLTTYAWPQATFKAGWETYKTGMVTHEYTYDYTYVDSFRLYLTDSTIILSSPDSGVVVIIDYPVRSKTFNKTIDYFNKRKLLLKTEEYQGENMMMVREWSYDDKNRKTYYHEENKASGITYKKNYDYSTDKKSGEQVITESSYYNGKIEFYTKSFYDRKNVKTKEVRLNDNNKDVIHIETYVYGNNGKVKERTVYFPEFKVTKKFIENNVDEVEGCYKSMPLGTEKIYMPGKIYYLKNFLYKIRALVTDPGCTKFEYEYHNTTNEIRVCTTKVNNGHQVIIAFKEKQP